MQLAHERLCIDEVFLNLQPPFMEEHLQLRDQLNFWHAVRVYTFGACLVAARDHHTLEWDSNSREQVGDGGPTPVLSIGSRPAATAASPEGDRGFKCPELSPYTRRSRN